ncbi:MAG: preprotein translocase subunit SecE [Phycisphaerales bacterium]|nr:preprotein translocase subunit SecE [Phycisphaerales bacterium]
MDKADSTTVVREQHRSPAEVGAGRQPLPPRKTARGGSRGFFHQYKPEQGKTTRTGTVAAAAALIAWGAYFIWDRLQVYEGDEWWRLLITTGIPLGFAVVVGAFAWRYSFAQPKTGDFMIATEGEMKKVNWSSRKEIIGSTKVVILFTALMAIFLFAVDLGFQKLFQFIGILRG